MWPVLGLLARLTRRPSTEDSGGTVAAAQRRLVGVGGTRPGVCDSPHKANGRGAVIGSGRFRERGFGLWLKFLSAPVDRNHKDGFAMGETWAVLGFWLVGRRVACCWC